MSEKDKFLILGLLSLILAKLCNDDVMMKTLWTLCASVCSIAYFTELFKDKK